MQNQPLLDVLTRAGVLISVSVRYWRAAKKLRPEDVGLEPGQVTARLISLGHKKLLPTEALAPFALIESRAHALVEAGTFPFLNGLGHFLPNTKLAEVTQRLQELKGEFQQAQADFVNRYAQLRRQACLDWRDAAHKLAVNAERLVSNIEAGFPAPERRTDSGRAGVRQEPDGQGDGECVSAAAAQVGRRADLRKPGGPERAEPAGGDPDRRSGRALRAARGGTGKSVCRQQEFGCQ